MIQMNWKLEKKNKEFCNGVKSNLANQMIKLCSTNTTHESTSNQGSMLKKAYKTFTQLVIWFWFVSLDVFFG